jgi:hypothetical protein
VLWEISDSQGGYYDDDLLEYINEKSCRNRRTFQRCVLPPASGRRLDDGGSTHLWHICLLLRHFAQMMEAIRIYETSVYFTRLHGGKKNCLATLCVVSIWMRDRFGGPSAVGYIRILVTVTGWYRPKRPTHCGHFLIYCASPWGL